MVVFILKDKTLTQNPASGLVRILDLVAMAKDMLSDHVVGMLMLAKSAGVIKTWEGQLFQLPFVKGMKLPCGYEHISHPFLDADQLVIVVDKRELRSSSTVDDLKDAAMQPSSTLGIHSLKGKLQ
jgi:hypothetical protein